MNATDTHETTLENEIKQYEIQHRQGGFGSSSDVIYNTKYTKIVAFAFHIPNEAGEIVKFNLTLRRYQRTRFSDPFSLRASYDSSSAEIEGSDNAIVIDLDSQSGGNAVESLTKFLNAQFEQIGKKLDHNTAIITAPENIDIKKLLTTATVTKVEDINLRSRLELLKKYRKFLNDNLDKNETFIQNWLDENEGKYRKERCVIFGLEYINHKREGELSRKRFDILTTTNELSREYVIMELKSPTDEVFKIVEKDNGNGGKATEYHLSDGLSRSIPQILHYKRLYDQKSDGDDDLQRIGTRSGRVIKCVIVVGQKHDDPVWKEHFYSLTENLSGIEIWTYTYLIEKLDAVIKNLEEVVEDE